MQCILAAKVKTKDLTTLPWGPTLSLHLIQEPTLKVVTLPPMDNQGVTTTQQREALFRPMDVRRLRRLNRVAHLPTLSILTTAVPLVLVLVHINLECLPMATLHMATTDSNHRRHHRQGNPQAPCPMSSLPITPTTTTNDRPFPALKAPTTLADRQWRPRPTTLTTVDIHPISRQCIATRTVPPPPFQWAMADLDLVRTVRRRRHIPLRASNQGHRTAHQMAFQKALNPTTRTQ